MRLMRLTCSPFDEFTLFAQNPPLIYYSLYLLLGSYLVAAILSPFIDQAANAQWVDNMNSGQLVMASAKLQAWKTLGLAVVPISQAIKTACLAALVWAFITLTGYNVPYKLLLTVVVAASMTCVLEGIAGVFVLAQRGLSEIRNTEDLIVSFGMDHFFSEASPFSASILSNLNPFEFWYMGLLSAGFWKAGRVPALVACAAGFLAWTVTVLAEAEILCLMSTLQSIVS